MKKIFKNLLVLVLAVLVTGMPSLALNDKIKTEVNIMQKFETDNIPDEIKFELKRETKFDEITLPGNSIITVKPLEAQKERRWHKSGFIVLQVISCEPPFNEKINLEDKEIYLTARKFEPIDPKEAAIIGTELAAAFSASYFIPGIDIAYFFTKGAILRKKHPNWFRAGVSNVYDNSICWFWLKGKPVELDENSDVSLKGIDKERAYKLKSQIEKRKAKQERRRLKKLQKKQRAENKLKVKQEVKAEVKPPEETPANTEPQPAVYSEEPSDKSDNTETEVKTETETPIEFELAPKIQSGILDRENKNAE